MRKLLLTVIFVFIISNIVFAESYEEMYNSAEPFKSKLYNDIDPFEDEDSIRYAWSPYPLFRTAADMYFKDYKIEPGYYSLVPRTLSGKDYLLFKQNGKVQFIIPVVKKEDTPLNFYDANTPKIKETKWQKFASGVRKKFYETAKDSMRVPPPKSVVNVDVESTYIIIVLYYGPNKYTVLFRRSPY